MFNGLAVILFLFSGYFIGILIYRALSSIHKYRKFSEYIETLAQDDEPRLFTESME